MRKVIFGILITIVVIGALLQVEKSLRVNGEIGKSEHLEAGKSLPGEFKLRNISNGEIVNLSKFKGKVVLINFWASWCEACMVEMPSIVQLYESLKGEGFEIVSVNMDEENPEKVVPSIVEEFKMRFPIYTDTEGELAKAFKIVGIPLSVVAGRDQKIIWVESGERDWSSDKVLTEIRKLLKST